MDYVIETDFEGPGFVAVPNRVIDLPLSPEGLGVLVWLARQPRGWIARASAIRERFSMGKDRWQRIARELREVGAITAVSRRDAAGRIVARSYRVGWPKDHEPENPAQGPQAGKPGRRETRQAEPENPARVGRETRLPNKTHKKTGRAQSATSAASGAASGQKGEAARAASCRGVSEGLTLGERATLAASLGLPYRDPTSGEWRSPTRSKNPAPLERSRTAQPEGVAHRGDVTGQGS